MNTDKEKVEKIEDEQLDKVEGGSMLAVVTMGLAAAAVNMGIVGGLMALFGGKK